MFYLIALIKEKMQSHHKVVVTPGDAGLSTVSTSSSDKWKCEVCTYDNWAASVKCAMCQTTNNKKVLTENQHNNRKTATTSSTSDIYKMGATSLSRSTSPQLHVTASPSSICTPEDNKWACPLCTYFNWPKALRCTQCLTPRRSRVSPGTTAMQRTPKSSNEVGVATQVATPPPSLESLRISTPSPPSKWNCSVCTYENWPRTRKCVLCGTIKEATPTRDEVGITPGSPLASGASSSRITDQEKSAGESNWDYERRMRTFRRRLREADWTWLTACMGVVEADMNPVEAYLNTGGDPTRKLTNPEVAMLNRPSVYEAGHTLVHLAIKFHREDVLSKLLSQIETSSNGSCSGFKIVPSYVAPDLASAIRRHVSQSLRQRKGPVPCYYISELATYTLPPEIEDLPPDTQEKLYSELLDRDAQHELEEDAAIINWSEEIRVRLGSRLHALWNRSAGDCLLDSALQATWGVFDRENTLRRAMADSLHEAGHLFYPRWRDWEMQQAMELDYTLDETQLAEDWASLLTLASQPGSSLEQLHIFVLAHVLRRPIIIYGVKYVKSWRGENLGYARFEGVYLPLLWEPSFCSRSPIALGYTRGHFCALVPPEPVVGQTLAIRTCSTMSGAACSIQDPASASSIVASPETDETTKATFLPLTTADRKSLLPIHFLTGNEAGNEEVLLRQWLDVCATENGLVVAQQKIIKPPLIVAQMTEEWLNHYRKLAQSSVAPFSTRTSNVGATGSGSTSGGVLHHHQRHRSSPTMICPTTPPTSSSGSNRQEINNVAHFDRPGGISNVSNINNVSGCSNGGGGYSSDGDSDEE